MTLKANPYTFKVTKHKLYFTAAFKEAFWIGYQAGNAPRKLLSEFGYDLNILGQKQIDSIVQRLKKEAQSGRGFSEGEQRERRPRMGDNENIGQEVSGSGSLQMNRLINELKYLRQEVEFIKKIIKGKPGRCGSGS